MFSTNVCSGDGDIMGHLPREISRPTKFLLDRCAKVTSSSSTKDHKTSVISWWTGDVCTVKVAMSKTAKAQLLMDRYREMADHLYNEPEEDVIVWHV